MSENIQKVNTEETVQLDQNVEAIPETKKGFLAWVKSHKTELILAGVSITTIIGVILGLKNKDALAELWATLSKSITKSPMETSVVASAATATPVLETVVSTRAYIPPTEAFDVSRHICRSCGYENDTTFENVKGICSDCGKIIPDPDGTLCADCRQERRRKAKEWLVTAGKVVGVVAAVAGAVYLASQSDGEESSNYTPKFGGGEDEEGATMRFNYVTDHWMETASEDELRSIENEMRAELDSMDYDSDEYLQLDLKRIDVVNAIASRFPLNLPHREHGWYLPNDD